MKLTRTVLSLLWLTAAGSGPAIAGLGADASSVEADRARLNGALRITQATGYAVHEIEAGGGLRIREYVGADGKVFAVSWRGPGIPDLRQMLGSYYAEYVQARQEPHYNHHHLAVRTADVVVESSGHTRAFAGRAWVPARLPQNFNPNDIN